MGIYKDAFIRYMEMEDIKYVEFPDGKVRVAFSGENMKSIPVYAIFDEKEGLVGMYC